MTTKDTPAQVTFQEFSPTKWDPCHKVWFSAKEAGTVNLRIRKLDDGSLEVDRLYYDSQPVPDSVIPILPLARYVEFGRETSPQTSDEL